MPQSRFDWHERIKAVEREYWAVRTAIDHLAAVIAHDPTVLGEQSKPRDLVSASESLDGTYIVRMFAEFETAIRSYWRTIRPMSRAHVEVLVDRVADRLAMPVNIRRGVHAVREYRNQLVHDRHQEVDGASVSVKDARHWLASYLARLPQEWDR